MNLHTGQGGARAGDLNAAQVRVRDVERAVDSPVQAGTHSSCCCDPCDQASVLHELPAHHHAKKILDQAGQQRGQENAPHELPVWLQSREDADQDVCDPRDQASVLHVLPAHHHAKKDLDQAGQQRGQENAPHELPVWLQPREDADQDVCDPRDQASLLHELPAHHHAKRILDQACDGDASVAMLRADGGYGYAAPRWPASGCG